MSNPRPNGAGESRWTFLRDAIDELQRKQSRIPARWFRPISEWANRQESSGLLRFWSPAPRVREAGDLWVIEDRNVRFDPFFLTSLLLHLILALLLWQALSELPKPELEKEKEVIVRLEELLPSEAGQAAAIPAPEPEPAKPAAAPKAEAKAPTPKATAPKPKPRPTPVVQKPVPEPEPEPILAPKSISKPKAISTKAPISPHTPTLSERVGEVRAPSAGAEVSMGAGASASDIDVDRGGATGVRGPAGPVAVPGGQGDGTGRGASTGRGDVQGSPMRGFETDPDFQEYLEKIKKRIQQVWAYPPGVAGKQTVVLVFRLDASARAYDVSVRRSSNVGLNQSAMDAMKHGSPFPPIPAKFRGLIGIPLALTVTVTITGTG